MCTCPDSFSSVPCDVLFCLLVVKLTSPPRLQATAPVHMLFSSPIFLRVLFGVVMFFYWIFSLPLKCFRPFMTLYTARSLHIFVISPSSVLAALCFPVKPPHPYFFLLVCFPVSPELKSNPTLFAGTRAPISSCERPPMRAFFLVLFTPVPQPGMVKLATESLRSVYSFLPRS